MTPLNSFASHSAFTVKGRTFRIARLDALRKKGFEPSKLPFSLRILLENLLRLEDGDVVKAADIETLAGWDPSKKLEKEIAFMPARVLLQDFTGVPAVVDLAAMRDAMKLMGGDPTKINPLQPVELVIDHSVQVDAFGSPEALGINAKLEFQRNQERYAFLRWGQDSFTNFKVVPPDTGIVHQVNLEYLARVVMTNLDAGGDTWAYPDSVIGTDSHTTMINGLGVLGWGVGGIEAEAAMLGQSTSMLIPEVVGFRLFGSLKEGVTATDLVLTVTQLLRKKGVVGKFVEFYGPGARALSLADRATVANMAPEYGATCGFFPVDEETLRYLELSGRPKDQIEIVRAYLQEQGLFYAEGTPDPVYADTLELDLADVEPSLAGPRRPQDRVALGQVKKEFTAKLPEIRVKGAASATGEGELKDGLVMIAAITSCTNTSNPSVLVAAGLLAKKAVAKGLSTKPWVKTSLAPGSQVVTEYLNKAGLTPYLEQLKFHTVGYGCTTCIGNSGPILEKYTKEIRDRSLVVSAVLSGNRNFEGRIHSDVRANYLASPPLVVAYAIAGSVDVDLTTEPLGIGSDGKPVFLKDVWPTQQEVNDAVRSSLTREMYVSKYAEVFRGDEAWQGLEVPQGATYAWEKDSTYVRNPPYFAGLTLEPKEVTDITGARVLAVLGDSITTDHISPAGSIKIDSPAGKYLIAQGVSPEDFNSYGARRGNHEVMMRGTFANVRLKNKLVPNTEGSVTQHLPDGEQMSIFDASLKYQSKKIPLVILAGKEYGSGSSRDWAAKGPMLLGIKAVIAESYERIHRSNLVGMGILPLEFVGGQNIESLGLTGHEVLEIKGLADGVKNQFRSNRQLKVIATTEDGSQKTFSTKVRIDTPQEVEYFRHGGVMAYVLRKLLRESPKE